MERSLEHAFPNVFTAWSGEVSAVVSFLGILSAATEMFSAKRHTPRGWEPDGVAGSRAPWWPFCAGAHPRG